MGKIKDFAYAFGERKVASFDENPVEKARNKFYFFQFVFNFIVTLVLFFISSVSIFNKIDKYGGFTTSSICLLCINGIYIFMIFVYYLIYKSKIKRTYTNLRTMSLLQYTKLIMKALKVIIPVYVLANIGDTESLRATTIMLSIFSLFVGIIGLFIQLLLFMRFISNKEEIKQKALKKEEKYTKFDNFYNQAKEKNTK